METLAKRLAKAFAQTLPKTLVILAAFGGAFGSASAQTSACPAGAFDPAAIDAALTAFIETGRDAKTDAARGESRDEGLWPTPAVALAVLRGDEVLVAGAAGCAQLEAAGRREQSACREPMTVSTLFRAASVSKMATAFAALSLARDGLLDLDADVSDYYGYRLRNPAYPAAAISLRQILSHVAGVRDPDAYWAVAPKAFRPLIEGNPAIFSAGDGPPGAYFVYSNLNYGIAAGAMEIAAGRRFDLLAAERVLAPLGLEAGFNWSGVPADRRRKGATLYRLVDGQWTAQVDDAPMLRAAGPTFLARDGLDRAAYLDAYAPGDNPTLFSPQGGLRANVTDLARLAAALAPGAPFAAAGEPLWAHDPDADNGKTEGGMFTRYGLGTQTVEAGGRTLVGHSGEAYGLLSGAWLLHDEAPRGEGAAPVSFAYAVTGTPAGALDGGTLAFTPPERRLIDLALQAARCAPAEANPAR